MSACLTSGGGRGSRRVSGADGAEYGDGAQTNKDKTMPKRLVRINGVPASKCGTHHCACDCREEKVIEMCRYLLHWDRSVHMANLDLQSVDAAVAIAKELYPNALEGK